MKKQYRPPELKEYMGQIKALISDLDGTLVDTFEANYQTYKVVFKMHNIDMSRQFYEENFGLRIDDLCKKLNILDKDEINTIKVEKSNLYPLKFNYLKLNIYLLSVFRNAKQQGIKISLASTASKKNVYNVLNYFKLENLFDIIICGEDVSKGKPNPEVYETALKKFNISSNEALVFEDSEIGMKAAENANINYVKIKM